MRSPKSPIDAAWLQAALTDTESVLRDHAHAERKAAATAMGLVAQYADIPELVEAMADRARHRGASPLPRGLRTDEEAGN